LYIMFFYFNIELFSNHKETPCFFAILPSFISSQSTGLAVDTILLLDFL
jgi:hypothetical protein